MATRRRLLWRALTAAAVLGCLSLPCRAAGDARRRKKLIACGWDRVNSERLLAHHVQMQQRPFDGVGVIIEGRVDAKRRCAMRSAFADTTWRREWFAPCVRNLKACTFTRFTDNFILIGANPGDVDWFDDAGWKHIVEHWRLAAWVARAAGFKGLVFDPEPYTPPHAQFKYAAQPQREKHDFNAYCAQARRRGREVMQAVATEYPDITILCYFMNSVVSQAAGQGDPRGALEPMGYGLYPAFIDGWLDAAAAGVRLVDGCESAYRYNSTVEYLEAAVSIKGACQVLVSPQNRARYRTQVQVGFGLYLDAYWNPKDSKWGTWYVDGKGIPRVDRLRINASTALRVADEYVWLWGEKYRWWPTPNSRVSAKTWPEALPGSERALRYARDPADYARFRIAELTAAGKAANRALNGDFASDKVVVADGRTAAWRKGAPPAGWGAWQADDSKGLFTWDRESGAAGKGSARAAAVAEGCFIQRCPVRPGQRYAVTASIKRHGRGRTWLRVRWQTAEDKWTAQGRDRLFSPAGPAGRWSEIFGVVEVPEAARQLVILLGVSDQPTDQDPAWFDDVALYNLD